MGTLGIRKHGLLVMLLLLLGRLEAIHVVVAALALYR